MSIDKLTLKNFQKHKDLELDIDENVTVLLGPSDVGKSSVIRSLKWLAANQPRGADFVNHGARKCTVELECEGNEIVRQRTPSGSKNLYKLNDKTFEAFGSDVPEEIQKTLRIDEDVNFQGQHDSPFWLSETAGQVSRDLNKIINLDAIDTVLSFFKSKCRASNSRIKVIDERLEELKEKRKNLGYILRTDEDLSVVEQKEVELQQKAETLRRIGQTIANIQRLHKQVKIAKEGAKTGGKAVEKGEKYNKVQQRVQKCKMLISEYKEVETIVNRGAPDISELEKAKQELVFVEGRKTKLQTAIENIRDAQEKIDRIEVPNKSKLNELKRQAQKAADIRTNRKNISMLIESYNNVNREIRRAKRELKVEKKKLDEFLADSCPTCGIGKKCPNCGVKLR